MSLFGALKRHAVAPRIEPVLNADPVPVSGITPGTEAYEWLTGWDGLVPSKPVSEKRAMSVSAVYACVALIGGAVASMPLQTYRLTDVGRERVKNDLWWALNEQMSVRWPAAVGWEYSMQAMLLHGDMFIRIIRASNVSPTIVGFEPLHPWRVMVTRKGDRLVYAYTDFYGAMHAVDQDDMIHVPGPGFDGLRGMSQIAYALRQPANIALDAGDQAANILSRGMRPDMAVIPPDHVKLDAKQITAMRTQWLERYSGDGKAVAPIMVTGGTKFQELNLKASDAQLLETRNFQVEDIARIFGVPPFMIGQMQKTTSFGSGVESMGIGFVKYTLQRHLVKIEQEFNRKCFRTARNFCEFDTRGLERGDIKTRTDAYSTSLGRGGAPGWMTVNEVRRAENMPPIADGDTVFKGNPNAPQPNPATA